DLAARTTTGATAARTAAGATATGTATALIFLAAAIDAGHRIRDGLDDPFGAFHRLKLLLGHRIECLLATLRGALRIGLDLLLQCVETREVELLGEIRRGLDQRFRQTGAQRRGGRSIDGDHAAADAGA